MALGKDLLNVALVVGGGYIFIYHVLPALQSGQLGAAFTPGGTFLPPAAATGHRCWVVNPSNGQKACACAGKQNFIMGVARDCPDCTTFCNTGAAPDLKRPTSNPTPPKQTGPVPGPVTGTPRPPQGQISANCRQGPNYQYCWKSGNLEVCQGSSCEAARQYWLQRYGSRPAPRPSTPAPSGTKCVASPTGFGSTKLWKCSGAGRTWTQGIGWRCNGRQASELYAGATCYP